MNRRRFSLRLSQRPGEPAHGLLLRLAERYGISPARLATRWGLSLGGLLRHLGINGFADALGIDADALIEWSPLVRTRARRVDLRGQELMLGDWSVTARRWCPDCFEEDARAGEHRAFHRALWDIGSIGLCPLHRVLLHSACPRCSLTTGWRVPRVAHCRCGFSFKNAPRVKVPLADSRMALVVTSRLDAHVDNSRVPTDLSLFGPPMADLSLAVLPSFTARFGAALHCPWSHRRPRRDGLDLQRDMSAALSAFPDPAGAFVDALDRISADRIGRAAGLGGAYGWVYTRWLAFPGQGYTGDTLVATMRDHAVRSGIIGPDEPVLGHAGSSSVTISGVADRLGVGFEKASALVQRTWSGHQAVRRGVAAAIPAKAVRELDEGRRRSMDGKTAAEVLGCSRRVVRELREVGVLSFEGGRYVAEQVLGLSARLAGIKPTIAPLTSLLNLARGGGCSVARSCAAILAGGIGTGTLAGGGTSLACVGVVAADVPNVRRAPDLSVRGLARRLSIHEEAVRQLVRLGLLSDSASTAPTAAGVAMFEDDFVTATEVARFAGLDRRAALSMLEALCVDRVLGPPACRQVFFRRRDVDCVRLAFVGVGLAANARCRGGTN